MSKFTNKVVCTLLAVALVIGLAPSTALVTAATGIDNHFVEQAQAASKPAKVTSVKMTSVKSTSAKVTWKKASSKKVKGYQVKVSTSKSFSKSKTKVYKVTNRTTVSKTVKSLKSNTRYYVKVRAYTISNGKTVYGEWSSVVKATTKKSSSSSSSATSSYVYVTPSGSKYHHAGCPTLSRSKTLTKLSISKAKSQGYTACKVCF